MIKLTFKIALPIILVGMFAVAALLAVGYAQLEAGFYIVVIFLVLFVFFFGISVGQNLSSPVKKILNNAQELCNGNLSSRVYLESKDELSQLAEAFNKIAEELKSSHDREENVEKSIGIKVKAKTEALEETINALEQKVKNRTIELERLVEESNKLQAEVAGKQGETAQLRKELSNFKQKVTKTKKAIEKTDNNI